MNGHHDLLELRPKALRLLSCHWASLMSAADCGSLQRTKIAVVIHMSCEQIAELLSH